jgi:hypothetical protein
MADTQTQQQPKNAAGWQDKVVIEVADDRNRNPIFPPNRATLRGRWNRANLRGSERVEQLEAFPDLPGSHIALDGRRRQADIYDPLSEDCGDLPTCLRAGERAETLLQAQQVYKRVFNRDCGPHPKTTVKDMTDTDIKTWLYWMRRLVDGTPVLTDEHHQKSGGPCARVVSGHMPDLDDILKMPGKIRQEFFNSRAGHKAFLGETKDVA